MPYTIPPGAIAAVTLLGKHENQQVMNVFHYKVMPVAPITDGRAYLDSFLTLLNTDANLVTAWKNCLSEKCVALQLRGQWIVPQRYAVIDRETAPGEGTVAGNAYPVNTSCSITRRTDMAGRREVGTIHVPAVPESFLLNGNITEAGVTAYNLLGVESIRRITDPETDGEWIPIHYGRSNPAEPNEITGYVLQPTARVMRRRTVGLGS